MGCFRKHVIRAAFGPIHGLTRIIHGVGFRKSPLMSNSSGFSRNPADLACFGLPGFQAFNLASHLGMSGVTPRFAWFAFCGADR